MIAVASVRSGGATTLALCLAACTEDAVVVEADPAGGVLALRYGLGREPGLITLASTHGPAPDLAAHCQLLPGGLATVVAPESPERAAQVLASAGRRLSATLVAEGPRTVVVDVGRLWASSPAAVLAAAAEVALVVARPRAEELVAAAEVVRFLGERAGIVLAGDGPYRPSEVADELGCWVFGPLAWDPRAAAALAEGGSPAALARSGLVRSARALARTVIGDPPPAARTGSRRRRPAEASV